jgi:hypothetical protein
MPLVRSAATLPMPPWWRAAGAKIKPGEPGEALHRHERGARCRRRAAPLDMLYRRTRTVAGGAIGREPLDAGILKSWTPEP